MVGTSGMRRRVLVASFLGLATQWSGNGLISYYLSPILNSIGITDNRTKNVINLGLSGWGFANAIVCALTATKFPRRRIYLVQRWSIVVAGVKTYLSGYFRSARPPSCLRSPV